jgi:hypothetical protein
MLADLIAHIEVNRNYLKSDLLQIIRILKNYDFFREAQLELFKPGRQRSRARRTSGSPAPAASLPTAGNPSVPKKSVS